MFRELTFPGFLRMSRASRNARRRTTERGQMLQTGAVICAALGIDTDLTLIYQVFALLFCALLAARIALRLRRPVVSVRRRLPRYATAGEPFEYAIDVINEGERVERDLTLVDTPVIVQPTVEQFRQHREPGEETRNAYDRWLGFHRFIWLQRLYTGINIKSAAAKEIPLRSRRRIPVEATPLRRGVVRFDAVVILHPDPLGLNYGITRFEAPEELLVLPKRYPVSADFHLPGSRHFQPGGFNTSWSNGESDEFVSLRDYRDGDSMRKIHWPSTARRGKPVVKEYQDEYFVRHALVLDTSSEQDERLDAAISVAASFVVAMSDADSMIDLVYLSTKPETITAGHGATNVTHQLEALAGARRTNLPVADLSDTVLRQASRLSGCILVFTDWCDVRLDLVEKLRGRGMPVKVLVIAGPGQPGELPAFVSVLEPGKIAEGLKGL